MNESEAAVRVLVCGVNWLGDAIMSMPALQAFRAAHPNVHLTLLSKPPLAALWSMQPAVDAVHLLDSGNGGVFSTGRRLKTDAFESCYILPNSTRSALVAWLARVPRRHGVRHAVRALLINQPVTLSTAPQARHQAYEYFDILGLSPPPGPLPAPQLTVPAEAAGRAREWLPKGKGTWIALIPGAARGPSKQWPPDRMVAVAQALLPRDCRFVVLGTRAEAELCAHVATQIGPAALSLAGSTSLCELAAVLAGCAATLCNDSGGMHLSAGVGTPVVAIYGLTNAAVTGPCGPGHRIVAAQGVMPSRRIARDSEAARSALASIPPERVETALMEILAERTP
jgi:heptosyltransferase-2